MHEMMYKMGMDIYTSISKSIGSLICVGIIVTILVWKKNKGITRYGKIIVYMYLYMIIWETLLSRAPHSRITYNLLKLGGFFRNKGEMRFTFENVLLFIPLGIGLPLVWERYKKSYKTIGFCFLCSCSIEILQLITQRGYFQLNDIVLNTLGGGIGYGMYWCYTRMRDGYCITWIKKN